MKERLKKRGLDVRQGRRMVQNRNERFRLVSGNAWEIARGIEPLTLMRCHSYMKQLKGGSLSVHEPIT